MSGDVQPRKRKDKKRKRDSLDRKSEGELTFSRKSSLQPAEGEEDEGTHHGVHVTKMGTDDVHLHVQTDDHGTGGNWCAKLFFFSLLAILVGLLGLIIMENRGLSDLDTPLSESRYSEYFEGWVDEHREAHDHDPHDVVAHEIEEHEEHDEPFEEEEDISEQDEETAEHDDEEDDHDNDDNNDDDDDDDENTAEDNEDDNDEDKTVEDDEDDNQTKEDTNEINADDDDDEDDEPEKPIEPIYSRVRREVQNEEPSRKTVEDTNEASEAKTKEDTKEVKEDSTVDDDNDDDGDDDDDDPFDEHVTNNKKSVKESQESAKITPEILEKQVDDLYESFNRIADTLNISKIETIVEEEQIKNRSKEEYDGTFESTEHIVDNDAEEIRLLQDKARQAQKDAGNLEPEEEEETSSPLAVKIGVGLALALVARLVLIRNGPVEDKAKSSTNEETCDAEPLNEEILMKRRLTIASADMQFDDEEEILDGENFEEDIENASEDGELEDEEYIEEIEEEIEIDIDELDEINKKQEEIKISKNISETPSYVPETFEQLNSMYRPNPVPTQSSLQSINPTFKKVDVFKIEEDKTKFEKNIAPISSNVTKKFMEPQQSSINTTKLESTMPFTTKSLKSDYYTEDIEEEEEEEAGDVDDILDEEEMYDEEELGEEELGEEEEEVGDDDADDEELMKRLEQKYGKLPPNADEFESEEEVEEVDGSWTKIKPRSGGGPQSYDTEDEFIDEQLRRANDHMLRDNFDTALNIYESLVLKYPDSPGALLGKAKAFDRLSEINKSNEMLTEAIKSYKRFLALGNDVINNDIYRGVSIICIERMRFLGLHSQAVPIHEALIKQFPNESALQNELAVTYLLIDRLTEAKIILRKILLRWPNDGLAKVHYGFVLKNLDNDLENAAKFLKDGVESNANGTQDGRFYFTLGDILQRLGRKTEARIIYRKGAKKNLFPSEYQRSMYNVENLKAKPIWLKKETPYESFFNMLERNWNQILEEGLTALNDKGYFIDESENLKDTGNWKQFELFSRGIKNQKNCQKAPITCKLIETFSPARFCRRGQSKFSVMHPRTHVWPHCGPTNCRLRAHLGLKIPRGTKIRIAKEERTWEEGKFLIFDDSFEHEVWHNGTSTRLVLIVDVWHPDLTEKQRKTLSSI